MSGSRPNIRRSPLIRNRIRAGTFSMFGVVTNMQAAGFQEQLRLPQQMPWILQVLDHLDRRDRVELPAHCLRKVVVEIALTTNLASRTAEPLRRALDGHDIVTGLRRDARPRRQRLRRDRRPRAGAPDVQTRTARSPPRACPAIVIACRTRRWTRCCARLTGRSLTGPRRESRLRARLAARASADACWAASPSGSPRAPLPA